jgi:hypothetical protein
MQQFLLLIVVIITITLTTLLSVPSSPFLIAGMTQADISNLYPTAITPAGITFSIWSVIYLMWIITGLMIALGKIEITKKQSIVYSLSILFTALWLVPWWYQMMWVALILMLMILGGLKYTFHLTRKSHPMLRSSVELTLGWINIATVANITVWLVSLGFNGAGIPEMYWAIGVLWLALLLTTYYQCRYTTYIISLVFLWTMLGEWIAHPLMEQRVAVGIYSAVIIMNMVYSYMKQR